MTSRPSKLRIISASDRHLDQLVPLFQGYLEFYRQSAPAARVRRFLRQRLQRRESRIFLAMLDGAPVGFTQLYPTFASVGLGRAWILYDLYVASDARRHGVATALLERAHRLGVATGAVELVLETGRANRQAQGLYKRLGWQRDDGFWLYRYYFRARK